MLVQGFINGMHHIDERLMSVRHLKLLMTVYLINRAFAKVYPTRKQISAMSKVPVDNLDPELAELVDKRYLVEIIPTFGNLTETYKLGSMGGTLMRHIMRK